MERKSKFWHPPKLWPGRTVYIIGGGPSIKELDLTPLHKERVIGCNDAYSLGSWVDVCYFGDYGWIEIHNKEWIKRPDGTEHPGLFVFPGLKVTCAPSIKTINDKSILRLERRPAGICLLPGKIAWNTNTGFSAINLAIIFGAKKIVLVGFDMKLEDGESNWHHNLKDSPNAILFKKFKSGSIRMMKELAEKCPDVEIINANPDSALNCFPKMKFEECI